MPHIIHTETPQPPVKTDTADLQEGDVFVPETQEPMRAARPESKLPKPTSRTLAPEDFYTYTHRLAPKDWAHVMIYVYRLWPRIIKLDPPKYIDAVAEPIDEAWLLKRHGEGDYQIRLNDVDKVNATICDCKPQIRNADYPPEVNLAELDVGHPHNRTFVESLKRKGRLTQDGEVVSRAGGFDPGGGAGTGVLAKAIVEMAQNVMRQSQTRDQSTEGVAVSKAFDLISSAGKQAVEMALNQVKQQDPQQFVSLLAALKELIPQGGNEKLFEMMLRVQADAQKQVAEIQKQNTDLLVRLVDSKRGGAEGGTKETLGMVSSILEIAEKIGGGGSPGNWKMQLIEAAAPLAEPLGRVLFGIGAYLASRGNPAAGTNAQAPPQSMARAELPPGTPQPQTQPIAGQEDGQMNPMVRALFGQIAQPLLTHISDPEITGRDFAAWFIDGYGALTFQQVQGFGKDRILEALKSFPELWQQLAPIEQRVTEFVGEFLEGPPPLEEEITEEVPPSRKGRPRKEAAQ